MTEKIQSAEETNHLYGSPKFNINLFPIIELYGFKKGYIQPTVYKYFRMCYALCCINYVGPSGYGALSSYKKFKNNLLEVC
jgi:hypothetical protein